MFGALLQGLFNFLPYRNVLLIAPVALALLYKAAVALLQTYGVLKNPWIEGSILKRTAILYADEHGQYEKPGDAQVCAIMLATRCNHPLGILAPGFKELGDRFTAMTKELDMNATELGFLGASTWINASDRFAGNEVMNMLYFKSPEECHAYAHGAMHTDTMLWWRNNEHNLKHIGIMHEIYAAPKHASEGVYLNYHPTGLGATFTEANVEGEKVWMSPLVEGKGKMMYSKGRMGKAFSEKSEWTAFEETVGGEERC